MQAAYLQLQSQQEYHIVRPLLLTTYTSKLASEIILNSISDHLPVFLFSEKYKSMKTESLIFEHSKFNNSTYQQFVRPNQKQISLV